MTTKVDGTNGILQSYDYQTPATGFAYTFAAGTQTLILNPAATLATGTITMPAAPVDGMVISFNSSQEITALTINGNTGQSIIGGGSVTLLKNATLSYVYRLASTSWFPFTNASFPIGVGQTWQNVTASRVAATAYTNSTGKPIYVVVTESSTSTYVFQVDGVTVNSFTASGYGTCVGAIVPNGSTYKLTGGSITIWSELR